MHMAMRIVCALIPLIALFSTVTALLTSDADIDVLNSIYRNTSGVGWNYAGMQQCAAALGNGVRWNFTKDAGGAYLNDPCDTTTSTSHFAGVGCVCAASCIITQLQVPCANLNGPLPASLGQLTDLIFFDVHSNLLNSTIPTELGALTGVTMLDVHSNKLTGALPSSIGNLTSLVTLNVYSNSLSSTLPPQLGNLTNLVNLNAHLNAFSGRIPATIGRLAKLQRLYLFENSLTGPLPAEISGLVAITYMQLGQNSLSGALPPELGSLATLTYLQLEQNSFSSAIPAQLGNLTKLQYLYCKQNNFTSILPASLSGLSKLYLFDFSDNQLTGEIPGDLGLLTTATSILLNGNYIVGGFPAGLQRATKLQYLDLSHNLLSGTISANVTLLPNLKSLILSDNSFVGQIPASIGALTRLSELVISRNSLTGSLPVGIQSCTNLGSLVLSDNSLSGEIPGILGELAQLEYLNLYNNHFTSSIPTNLDRAISLKYVELYNNQLVGSIPVGMSALVMLVSLQLYNNRLTGPIPPDAGRWTKMKILLLHENQLTGPVPSAISTFSGLITLSLGRNMLTGSISFINAAVQTQLTTIDLAVNGLTGTLPDGIFALPLLQTLIAGANCFSGSFPSNVCNALNLNTLDITGLSSSSVCSDRIWGGTAFRAAYDWDAVSTTYLMDGTLPSCVFSLPKMEYMYASANYFAGDFPITFSSSLKSVIASRNRLGGTISYEVAQASSTPGGLSVLDLSFNRISGNLDAFEETQGTYFMQAGAMLNLKVNRLSGIIPAALQTSNNVDLLNGNVFDCDGERNELPPADKDFEQYQCGSDKFNNIFYLSFAFIFIFVVAAFALVYHSRLKACFNEFRSWLELASGRSDIPGTNTIVSVTHVRRYSEYLEGLRTVYSMLGCGLFVVFIVYSQLNESDRTVTQTYGWFSTAAYLTGSASTVYLVLFTILFVLYVRFQMVNDTRRHLKADISATVIENENTEQPASELQTMSSFAEWSITMLRLNILLCFIWAIAAVVNEWYLHVARHGTVSNQATATFVYALFLLVWTMQVTPYMFSNELFFWGLSETRHHACLKRVFGSLISLQVVVNTGSAFGIPLLTALVKEHACFLNAFFAHPPSTTSATFLVSAVLNPYMIPSAPLTVSTKVVAPFIYSYTCSNEIIRLYTGVYQIYFIVLFARSVLHICYLVWDSNHGDKRNRSAAEMSSVHSWFVATMPTDPLLRGSAYRRNTYRNGSIFPDAGINWMSSGVTHHLWSLLILLTFGYIVPALAFVVIFNIILDTYVAQLILGRFLYMELPVAVEMKQQSGGVGAGAGAGTSKYIPPTRPRTINDQDIISRDLDALEPQEVIISEQQRVFMSDGIKNVSQLWGAVATLRAVEAQCSQMPASMLELARTLLVFLPCFVVAFVTNDTLNSTHDNIDHLVAPSIILILFPFGLEMCFWGYNKLTSSTDTVIAGISTVDTDITIGGRYAPDTVNPIVSSSVDDL